MVSDAVTHSFNLRHDLTQPFKSDPISLIVVFKFKSILHYIPELGCIIVKQFHQISKSEHYITRHILKKYTSCFKPLAKRKAHFVLVVLCFCRSVCCNSSLDVKPLMKTWIISVQSAMSDAHISTPNIFSVSQCFLIPAHREDFSLLA